MSFSNTSFSVPFAKRALRSAAKAGLKSLGGLSLAIVLSASNTASAQEATPTPSCPPDTFKTMLTGAQEVPPNNSTATGSGDVVLNRDPAGATISVSVTFTGLAANATAAHIHGPAMPGVIAPVIIPFPDFPASTSGTYSNTFPITPEQIEQLVSGLLYINIHNAPFPDGEIRGQLKGCDPEPSPTPSPTPSPAATPTPTATPTGTPNASPSPTPTATASATPVASPTPGFEGNFVIGDLDAVVGNQVTFWSPCWAKVNHLSGGMAPNSFKGFARHPNPNPAECGGTWRTTPGNSSHPPTILPEQIVAIAASSITKNGSIISGDIPMLVVIETNSDASPPGHSRTGTVVAIICGTGPSPTPTCAPNTFTATLTGDQEVPPNNSTATGSGSVVLNSDPALSTITVNLTFSGLTADATDAHIHGPAMPGVTAPVIIPLTDFPASTSGTYSNTFPITPEQVSQLLDGLLYINIHNTPFPGGEIRGQLLGCGPTPSPTATPTPGVATALANISTRLQVETADNILIGGLIITGDTPKNVLLRACGGSLPLPNRLADPILELHDASGHMIASNDNWRDAANVQEIINTTIPPENELESAILTTLEPGAYTALVRGSNGGTGIALVEAYDLDQSSNSCSNLSNISTRGLVQTGDKALISGLIVLGQEPLDVMVRAIAPSVPMAGTLADPTLELRSSDGTLIASNDNWRSDQEAEIIATGIAPPHDLESAIVRQLPPGLYTAIVRSVNDTTGIALVEVYSLE